MSNENKFQLEMRAISVWRGCRAGCVTYIYPLTGYGAFSSFQPWRVNPQYETHL